MKESNSTPPKRLHQIRWALTGTAIGFLICSPLVICLSSPDVSESAAEFLSSLAPAGDVQVQRDISYVDKPDRYRTGDLYTALSPGGSRRPAIVIVHGGGWYNGSKRDFIEVSMARYFARNGYAAFAIDYRLLPSDGQFPSDILDVKQALAYLAANATNLGIDPARLFILGSSTGASAAMMAAYTPDSDGFGNDNQKGSRARAVVSISGPTDLAKEAHHPNVRDYLGSKGKPPTKELLRKASPMTYVGNAVPTLLLHGAEDRNVSIEHSLQLEQALRKHNVPVSLLRVEGQGHFIGAASRKVCLPKILSFFSDHGSWSNRSD